MRIYFDSMAHPKRLAKRLTSATGQKLNASQAAVARMFGHADWHALEATTEHLGRRRASLPDRFCAPDVVASRFVFQCHSLAQSFDLDEDEADALVRKLRPTDAFRTAEEREHAAILQLMFPTPWERELSYEVLDDMMLGDVDSLDVEDGITVIVLNPEEELAEGAAVGNGAADAPQYGGTRVLSVFDDAGDKWAALFFIVEPTINQDIVVGLDITLGKLGDLEQGELAAEAIDLIARCLVLYLSSPTLNAYSTHEISGAVDGICVRLHGHLDSPNLCELAACFMEALEECHDAFADFGHDDPPELNHAEFDPNCSLPVRAIEDSTTSDYIQASEAGEDDEGDDSHEIGKYADEIDEIPQMLGEYLKGRGRADLAAFADHHSLRGDKVATLEFLSFLGATSRAGALPLDLARTLRMVTVRCFADRLAAERGEPAPLDAAERRSRDVTTARELGEPALADYFESVSATEVNNDFRKGFAELIGLDPSDLAAIDDARDEAGKLMSASDFHKFASTLLKRALGRDVDPADFIRQMRINGGLIGVPHEDWYQCLKHLGWDVVGEPREVVARFDPSFWVSTRDGTIELPVVVEGYAYVPEDTTDVLAKEAFEVLAAKFPKGCLLLFGALHFKKIQDRCYTCGGMLLRDGHWAPFALSERVDGLERLLAQRQAGFSFDAPLSEYEDPCGVLAVSFNLMVRGHDFERDPNPDVMVMEVHGWKLPVG
ncbi:hypothetical protein [Burkholderia sp. Ac-20365]|uniref:hypothetical protein n=1 Tax=Burkholderia sp. Ac-20365 TaxID=2703897 RepID=UPI00197C0359|nr:hypothetical protein [Burkholderia sp. Ac-20365]MBN3761020.1 hypothetical protein [Burkholderia sp. Ac-20365]